ncbi:TIGR04282 family arsenosugar biosynthesis glycosyltransferase [Aurantiacibacter sp. MUD61]|uniref:TIGR04282 family arsenosugar biosynthesis glycosyltransferase n=1 Tax=Aurantiacibacter sp. MUD61 TaxID=3009083 RepID=UPI0022EFD90A|nr:TIGR04282 family arsenosugar biosynthesis glycosyltransferase [Aurantiacibacter sp. MUD61]
MADPLPTIALFAKYPQAGKAKTRLIPALGEGGAAALHRRLVERTLATIREGGLPFAVWTTGAPHRDFADWLGDDVTLVEQGDGDLGARLSRVTAPAILLGADIPGLTAQHLRDAAKALETNDAVIGPASDGGYYLLGFQRQLPFLWQNMAWGTEVVLAETEARLLAHGTAYATLAELDDCDRPEDLAAWPELTA